MYVCVAVVCMYVCMKYFFRRMLVLEFRSNYCKWKKIKKNKNEEEQEEEEQNNANAGRKL